MMWPSSQGSKILLVGLLLLIVYCALMDVQFYFRIKYYPIDAFDGLPTVNRSASDSQIEYNSTAITTTSATKSINAPVFYENVSWVGCKISPICVPTVKALMIDHINHYIYGPLCSILDLALAISDDWTYITPNMISYAHVGVAIVGAKLLTSNCLGWRRIAVVLFQIRMFMDDLDGHVARTRKHIKGERSEVGSYGYWVDGICDLIGVIAMMLGVTVFLRYYPPRRGYKGLSLSTLPYHQLGEINGREDLESKDPDTGMSYKTKVSFLLIVRVIILFSAQMVISSLAWNRYIDIYQEAMESTGGFAADKISRQSFVFRSDSFFGVAWTWKLVNPHSFLHLLSLAIFCDKLWPFMRTMQLAGYVALAFVICLTEVYATKTRAFITGTLPNFAMSL